MMDMNREEYLYSPVVLGFDVCQSIETRVVALLDRPYRLFARSFVIFRAIFRMGHKLAMHL